MDLLPIDFNESKNDIFRNNPDCADVLNMYPMYYQMTGYSVPWIGYFATNEAGVIVGAGGFKGRPKMNKIEIAYGIFKQYEGQRFGSQLCRELVQVALSADPGVIITARTLMEENASVKLLKRNNFSFKGVVFDEDDGDVWEWEYSGERGGSRGTH